MIPAKKSIFWEKGFNLFVTRLVKHYFNNIYIQGSPPISTQRTLFLPNHSTWWDPVIIFLLNRHVLQADSYAMMHESGLKDVPIFQKIGAFSVNKESRRDILASLQYAKERLEEGKSVWMFPQGDEHHLEQRPLAFQSGAAYLAKKVEEIQIVPVALYYTFQSSRKANVYVSLGNAIHPMDSSLNKSEWNAHLEVISTALLDNVKSNIIHHNTKDYYPLL
ncbi:lysophospholipid acyltransferase family protein [Pontibacillus salicampi]|uniref:Lysophospholipid acyltransferase family protein n=1 Tax=Pontibacillus salicampi TaxID=1449801 RepID=A0ABV6LIJ1_9BACI